MLILEFEFIRLDLKVNIPDPFGIMRKQEKRTATGMLFFVLAIIVVFSVFDFKIALTAILMTTFGDLASALMGIRYGRHKLKSGKSLEGFAAGFVTNLLIGAVFLWEFPMIVIGMAFVASIVELVTYKLDDNLTVPVFAGFTGHTIAYIMGINLVQLTNPIRDFFLFLSNFF
jgi:dolichol kinase